MGSFVVHRLIKLKVVVPGVLIYLTYVLFEATLRKTDVTITCKSFIARRHACSTKKETSACHIQIEPVRFLLAVQPFFFSAWRAPLACFFVVFILSQHSQHTSRQFFFFLFLISLPVVSALT